MTLYVDTREPAGLKQALVDCLGADEVSFLTLDSADFVVIDFMGASVGIERKTIADFLHSMDEVVKAGDTRRTHEYRLQQQFNRMDSTYTGGRILLLEGTATVSPNGKLITDGRLTGWTYAAYQMLLYSMQRRRGFDLLCTADHATTIELLRTLHNHIIVRSVAPTQLWVASNAQIKPSWQRVKKLRKKDAPPASKPVERGVMSETVGANRTEE